MLYATCDLRLDFHRYYCHGRYKGTLLSCTIWRSPNPEMLRNSHTFVHIPWVCSWLDFHDTGEMDKDRTPTKDTCLRWSLERLSKDVQCRGRPSPKCRTFKRIKMQVVFFDLLLLMPYFVRNNPERIVLYREGLKINPSTKIPSLIEWRWDSAQLHMA